MAKIKTNSSTKKVLSTFLMSFTKKAANEIKVEAKNLCPVDSGKLKRSITVQQDGDTFSIGSPLDYAIYVEAGTRFQSPQSFLRKAYFNTIQKYL